MTQTTSSSQSPPAAQPKRRLSKRLLIVGGIFLALVAFIVIRNLPHEPKDRLLVSGRIEGYETNIGAKVGGRIQFIGYREGAIVHKGDLLVKLDDADLQAQLRGAVARIARAVAQRANAEEQLSVSKAQIAEANLNIQQARLDAMGRMEQGEANVAQAQANLRDAEAQLTQAKSQLQLTALRKRRFDYLVAQGAVSSDESDQANTNYQTAAALVKSKEAAVQAAAKQARAQQGLLAQAQSSRYNPPIKSAQQVVTQRQLAQSVAQLASANQDVADATAARDQIIANIAYLNITSPINGTVTARTVEPGAVVSAGQTVLTVLDFDSVYLRAYVPEGDIGNVRIGQAAEVYLDSAPKTAIAGEVIEIDPEASFTPENIYFKEDRVKQVFGIRIGFRKQDGSIKPGMPADAYLMLRRR